MRKRFVIAVSAVMLIALITVGAAQASPNLDITTGLVGYWKFDEFAGQTAIDSSGNGHNGTLGTSVGADASDPSYVIGKIGGALSFDGFDDFTSVPDDPALELTSQYTWSMWVKGNAAPTSGSGVSSTQPISNAGQQFIFSWDHPNGAFQTAATHESGSSFPKAQISTPLAADTWYHVAATFDGTTIKVYLNGALEDSAPAGLPNAAAGDLVFGAAASLAAFFGGQIDEVRVYDRALSDPDVLELFNFDGTTANSFPTVDLISDQQMDINATLNVPVSATDPDLGDTVGFHSLNLPPFATLTDNGDGTGNISLTPGFNDDGIYPITVIGIDGGGLLDTEDFTLTVNDTVDINAGLIGRWRFDEFTGQTALDSSGNAHDGTLGSSAVADSSDPTYVLGQIGGALSFDGADDFVRVPDSPAFELTSEYTWSMWIKGDSAPASGFGLNATQPISNADQQFVFSWDHPNPDFKTAATHESGAVFPKAQISTVLSADTWYHIAATFDGSTIKVYLNGALEDSAPAGPPNAVAGDLIFGAAATALVNFFGGQIDEVRVYDRELNAPEIDNLFNFDGTDGNDFPVIDVIGNQAVGEGATLDVPIIVNDPNAGDIITILSLALPGFATLTDNGNGTGTVSFSPGSDDAGTYPIEIIAIDDGGLLDTEQFILTVVDVVDVTIGLVINEGETNQTSIFSTDGNPLVTFSAAGLPPFAAFVDNANGTATLTASPGFTDAGVYTGIQITGSDGSSTDTTNFAITVLNVNRPPVLDPIGDLEALADTIVQVDVTANDPDGNAGLQLLAVNLPSFASFVDNGNGSGTLTLSPTAADEAVYPNVVIEAFDGEFFAPEFFTVTVIVPDIGAGLVGRWAFDELSGQVALDSSGNGNDGTLGLFPIADSSDPSFVFGQIGGALSFDGFDDFVAVPDDPAFELPVYTWSMWIKGNAVPTSGVTTTQPISNADQQFVFSWDHVNGAFTTAATHESGVVFPKAQITTPLSADTWYHIITTFDGATLKIYLNGVLEDSVPAGPPNTAVGDLVFGAAASALANFFGGELDDIRVYNRVLNDPEIQALFLFDGTGSNSPPVLNPIGNQVMDANSSLDVPISANDPDLGDTPSFFGQNLPPFVNITDNGNGTGTISFNPSITDFGIFNITVIVSDGSGLLDSEAFTLTVNEIVDITVGLVGYWPFDDLEGQIASDSSANANNGSLGASASIASDDPVWTLGQIGGALDFDGSNDFVTAGDQPEFVLTQYTYSMWVNGDTAPGTSATTQPLSNANQQFSLSWDHTRSQFVTSATHDSGTDFHVYKPAQISTTLLPGTWYHIAATYDGAAIRIYLNGVLEGIVASGPPATALGDLVIGSGFDGVTQQPSIFFDGQVDDARIYDRALSDAEVLALFQFDGSIPGNSAPSIDAITNQMVDENAVLNLNISANDLDGDSITLLSFDLPPFAVLTDNGNGTGTISFSPGFADQGLYPITVVAKDSNNLISTESFNLTVNDVANLANGLVARWSFEEVGGQAVLDSSGNGHNGTLGTSIDGDAGEPARVAGNAGNGNALDFDGADDFVTVTDDPAFELPTYSYAMWIKGDTAPGTTTTTQPISNAEQQFVFSWDHTNGAFVTSGTHQSGTSYSSAQLSTPLLASTWYHIGVTYDGTFIRIYLNGNLEGVAASGPPNAAIGDLLFGATASLGTFFDGQLDEINVYDRPLSDLEMQTLAN